MEIKRKNSFGFATWTVVDTATDAEIVTFDLYCDAAEFVRFLNEM